MRALLHLGGNLAPALAGLVTAPLTARALGPELRGELAIVMVAAVLIGLVGAFGLGPLARQAVSEDIGQSHGWSRRGQRITLWCGGMAAAVGASVAGALGFAWLETVATVTYFALAGMSASKSIDANLLIVAGRTKHFGIANLAAAAAICTGITSAFLLGLLTLWVVIALNAAALLTQMLYIVIQRKRFLNSTKPSQFIEERFRSLWKRSWHAWRSQLVEAVLLRSDTGIFITQASVAAVGYYAVVALIPQMMYQVFLTLIQHSYATSPRLNIRKRTTMLWQLCVMISVPLSVGAGGVALVLIPVLFGQEFLPSLQLISPACFMALSLSGLAPVLQHFAISPTNDRWFPVACVVVVAGGWIIGGNHGSAAGVVALSAGFALVSGAYVYLISGLRAFKITPASFSILFGKQAGAG